MKALFKVDEEVILQSKNNPQCNGECIIRGIVGPRNFEDSVSGKIIYGISYQLTTAHPEGYLWAEISIKKKYTPGDSLESIMSSLKSQTLASYMDGKANRIAEIFKGINQVKED